MLGITLRDYKRNTWIRHQTGVNDIIDVIKKGIHGWAGHIARFKDNRWTKSVTEWTPREWTSRQGRPKTRWRDNLIRHLGPAWPRIDSSGLVWSIFRFARIHEFYGDGAIQIHVSAAILSDEILHRLT